MIHRKLLKPLSWYQKEGVALMDDKKMEKEEYKNYLNSVDWLLKKTELINLYLEKGWKIQCFQCGITKKLQVHHTDYERVGNENLMDLQFICADCHKRWYCDKAYRDVIFWDKEPMDWFVNFVEKQKYGV